MWAFGEHVVNFWRLRRGGLKTGVWAPHQVELKDGRNRPTGIVAELDADQSFANLPMNGLDMLRAEPLVGRAPNQRELDELFDAQRESTRIPPVNVGGLVRGSHSDSGVISATAPVERERF